MKYIVKDADGSIIVTKARFGNNPDALGRPRCLKFQLGWRFFNSPDAKPMIFKQCVRADVARVVAERHLRESFPGQSFNLKLKAI